MLRPLALLLAASLFLSLPAMAQSDQRPNSAEDPAEMAREGAQKIIQGLKLLIDKIPQYEMPVINEDGDIIIRRKRSPAEPPAEKTAPPGGTRT